MKPICIVTDSTSDIPEGIAKKLGIEIIPLTINYKGKSYRDKIDIKMEELLEMLKESDDIPTTSQVNPLSFYEVYNRLLSEGKQIISIHISSKLSGTYQSALIARDMCSSNDIYVIDSKGVSFGTGIVSIEAAKMINRGMNIDDIVNNIEELTEKVRTIVVLDTLHYLKKGGRISYTNAAIGTLLNIKPIIIMKEGKLEAYAKTRSFKKALEKVQEYIIQENCNKKLTFAFGNVAAEAEMINFSESLKDLIGLEDKLFGEIGAVIACYSGPGAVGIFFFTK